MRNTKEREETRRRKAITRRIVKQHPGRLSREDNRFLRSAKIAGAISGLCAIVMLCVTIQHIREFQSWQPEVLETYVIQAQPEGTSENVVDDKMPIADWTVYAEQELPIEAALNAVSYNCYLDCSEQDFLTVIRAADGISRHDQVCVRAGDVLYVHAYVRNASDATAAEGVRISSFFAPEVAAGEVGEIGVTLSADNTEFATIYNEVVIFADTDVRLEYIPGSLAVSTSGAFNNQTLSEKELFSDNGVLLGYDQQDGVLPGGAEHALEVIYYLRVAAVDDPQTVEDFFKGFSHPEPVMLATQ